jgi:hypothetical protein
MRERWYGATGRRVPELVLDGTLNVEDALVLDAVSEVETLVAAHQGGVPIVVRACTREQIVAALSRPEVACVLVPVADLLDLDLSELTYG